jgi:hypothetical protein
MAKYKSILKEAVEEYRKIKGNKNKKPDEFWIIITLLCMIIREIRKRK